MSLLATVSEVAMAEVARTPAVLYKYCPIGTAERIFQSGGVRLNSPSSFNDPFDMRIGVKWPEDDNVLRACIAAVYPEEDRDAAFQSARRRREQYPDMLPPNVAGMLENTGISCFSKIRDNILMWAHYANKHQGVCLGFRWQAVRSCLIGAGLEAGIRIMKEVSYSDDFPVWEVAAEDSHKVNLLTTKAYCWEYEQEWRIYAPDLAGKFQPFTKDAFHSVIFGAKISEDDECRIIRVIQDGGYTPELRRAKIAPNQYKLDISPCV